MADTDQNPGDVTSTNRVPPPHISFAGEGTGALGAAIILDSIRRAPVDALLAEHL